jgi:SAM-dependent methyltransferase
MNSDQIKAYWEERAASDSSALSTTQDFYLREIEFRVLRDLVERHRPRTVLDVGCGDARTTARLAAEFAGVDFIGGDYSESMVKNAQDSIARMGIENLHVFLCDVTRPLAQRQQEMIFSTRCLINLPTWQFQQTAIRNISDALVDGGLYVMIENFLEGHESFNRVRADFGLPEIPMRGHNLFFERTALLDFVTQYFEVLEDTNISSTYYLVSRVIYSKLCQEGGSEPDYFDPHHQYAARLPFCGEFGPVRMICMRGK